MDDFSNISTHSQQYRPCQRDVCSLPGGRPGRGHAALSGGPNPGFLQHLKVTLGCLQTVFIMGWFADHLYRLFRRDIHVVQPFADDMHAQDRRVNIARG